MKISKNLVITIIVVAAVVAILLYNKSRNAVKSRSEILTSVPVSVTEVTKQRLSDARSFVGTISAYNDVAIISETQGKVTEVMAEVGQHIGAGSPIVQVDDELKRANFIASETNFEKAKKDLERFESLYKQSAATDQQMDGARLAARGAEAQYLVAKRQYNDTRISTPISGILTSRTVDMGTYVSPGMVVGNVVDISRLKVKLNVSESDAFALKPGDVVEISTDVYPRVSYTGKIKSISTKADESHTYPVEVVFDNSSANPLKAGMFCRVKFKSKTGTETLVIPREALVGSMKSPQVYVVDGPVARLRQITVDGEIGTSLAVGGGLKEGETVVVSGQNNLKDSVSVTVMK